MNIAGLLCIAFLVLWFPLCGFVGHQLKKRQAKKQDRPDPVAPTPPHVHILDIDRSEITITEAGGVLARCILAGCKESVYIAPNLGNTFIVESVEVRK
jgi:hypothetical protein